MTGPPAAGKTTIAHDLARRLCLPLITKDTIKEALFDELGVGDLEWSARLGGATYGVMVALVEESVTTSGSLVVEANFVRGSELEARFSVLAATVVQVHCSAPLEVLLRRYAVRERHPGHVDVERIAGLREAVETGRHDPLDLAGETIRVDTSQPVDVETLAAQIAG